MNASTAPTRLIPAFGSRADRSSAREDDDRLGHRASQGARYGAVTGALLGMLVACVAGATSSVVLPGIHELDAPLALALLGALAGLANGTLVGALVGWSIPEEIE